MTFKTLHTISKGGFQITEIEIPHTACMLGDINVAIGNTRLHELAS